MDDHWEDKQEEIGHRQFLASFGGVEFFIGQHIMKFLCPGGGICRFGILICCRMKMSSVPLHNYTDSLRYGHMKLTHQTNFYWDGMGMLRTLLGHNNTWHVSLEPKMAFPGVRIVIGSILSALQAWNVFPTLWSKISILCRYRLNQVLWSKSS